MLEMVEVIDVQPKTNWASRTPTLTSISQEVEVKNLNRKDRLSSASQESSQKMVEP
ncbi:unnamed protein product [Strongylus vulgaris]|uniref:Uncharacterized protein n=1 Tax=Strongylus vulgaris TaxID=40348 RepID=A0A3P7JVQ5_STRVU|nr:unnamed protein product [Strongylus vulgaris]